MNSTTTPINKMQEVKEAFDLVDKARVGKINRKQLELLIKILGFPPQKLENINQPEYTFTDVQNIVANMNPHDTKELEEQFITLCKRYDPENSGFITIPQMAQVLKEFDEDVSEEEFLETMRLGEQDYGDQIDYKKIFISNVT